MPHERLLTNFALNTTLKFFYLLPYRQIEIVAITNFDVTAFNFCMTDFFVLRRPIPPIIPVHYRLKLYQIKKHRSQFIRTSAVPLI
ncbi:hypothetical protein FD04_GL002205 [Secundilactobacillus odoratitofui DSM 19909 = JCM 15043]|uniref:Uncharacterized protein n=1 Tax=Secundilactobacillus odoratitofui DSM 19909 = JCM 15043 TaxID=1423776 RepID=A0A0R1M3K2_9LACO|nr:hypothetical protein FD04_GL002205 [Secundilactobacillus odoratitofui DSM 19909 = JCM 15043]